MEEEKTMVKSLIKPVEIDITEPCPDKPGYVRLADRLTHGQFAQQVETNLKILGLDTWEWLSATSNGRKLKSDQIVVGLRRGNETHMIVVMESGLNVLTIKHFGEMAEALAIIEAIYAMAHEVESQLARRYPAPVEG